MFVMQVNNDIKSRNSYFSVFDNIQVYIVIVIDKLCSWISREKNEDLFFKQPVRIYMLCTTRAQERMEQFPPVAPYLEVSNENARGPKIEDIRTPQS